MKPQKSSETLRNLPRFLPLLSSFISGSKRTSLHQVSPDIRIVVDDLDGRTWSDRAHVRTNHSRGAVLGPNNESIGPLENCLSKLETDARHHIVDQFRRLSQLQNCSVVAHVDRQTGIADYQIEQRRNDSLVFAQRVSRTHIGVAELNLLTNGWFEDGFLPGSIAARLLWRTTLRGRGRDRLPDEIHGVGWHLIRDDLDCRDVPDVPHVGFQRRLEETSESRRYLGILRTKTFLLVLDQLVVVV